MPIAPKNQQKGGYLLPGVINPDENICVCVPVPKDWGHIRAFLGQLTALAKWQTWEKDGTTSASDAARRWFEITECVAKEIDCIMSNDCGCSSDEELQSGRINEDGFYEQYNPDTGQWEVNTAVDPRFNGIIYPPMEGADGSTKKCKAANSLVTTVKAEQERQLALLVAGATFAELVAGITQFLVGIAVITGGTTAILAVITTIVAAFVAGILSSDFEAAFTEETWDEFLCLVFCSIEDDGSFTHEGYRELMAKSLLNIGGTAGGWLQKLVISMGTVGLTNAARSGRAGTRSCDGCACADCSNLDNWQVIYGTILETSPGYMRLSSTDAGSGNQAVRLANYTDPPNECCAVTYNIISGTATNQAYYPCGSPDPVFSVPPADTCMWDINVTNVFSAPMEIEFFFGECP